MASSLAPMYHAFSFVNLWKTLSLKNFHQLTHGALEKDMNIPDTMGELAIPLYWPVESLYRYEINFDEKNRIYSIKSTALSENKIRGCQNLACLFSMSIIINKSAKQQHQVKS